MTISKITLKYFSITNSGKYIFIMLLFILGWLSCESYHYLKDNNACLFLKKSQYVPTYQIEIMLNQLEAEQTYVEKARQEDIDKGVNPMPLYHYISKYKYSKNNDFDKRR